MAYTIKKVEKETKISAHTLRFWAKKGLFPFVQKDENSVKYFSKSDIEWVKWIEWLRISGMPIEQIKHYIKLCSLGIKTAKERQEMLKQTKKKLQNQIKTLKESEKVLSKKIKFMKKCLQMKSMGLIQKARTINLVINCISLRVDFILRANLGNNIFIFFNNIFKL